MAAALLVAVGGLLALGIAEATLSGQRMVLAAQARRLLQQDLEQVRSGRGIPASGTVGPFQVTVATQSAPQPAVVGGSPPLWSPDCYGGSPCVNTLVLTGAASLTQVTVTITNSADGSVLAKGTTSTP